MDKTGLVILLLLALSMLPLGDSREYHYVKKLATWSEAQSYCRENFVDLATIETKEDWEKVRRIMKNAEGPVWIGLYDDVYNWRWSIDNTYLSNDGNELGAWFVFENRRTQKCVEIFGGKLYDTSCNVLKNSVCYDESTNTYIAVTVPATWSSAQSNCREKYTDLTSMRNQQEKEAILSVIDESHWWIGLFRLGWTWSDQSNSSLRVWGGVEPNSPGTENCAATLLTGWNDIHCGLTYKFMCSVPEIKLFKIVLKVEGSVDPNDPLVQEAVLNNMVKNMKNQGIHQKVRLTWRKQPNGKKII